MTTSTPPPAPGSTVTLDKTKLATILASVLALVLSLIALVNGGGTASSSASDSSLPAVVSSSSAPTSPSSAPIARGCLTRLADCGYPDASSTGAHGQMTVHVGKLVTDHDGQVVEDVDIQGCLQVKNAGVVIRDVKIDGGCTYSLDTTNATGPTTISDVTVRAGSGQAAAAALRDVTAARLDVSGGNDIVKMWGTSTLTDSYLHDATRTTGSHDDAIQIVSGGPYTIEHNTILIYTGGTVGQWAQGIGDPMNACLQVGTLNGALDVITFARNACDGGNYSINGGAGGTFAMAAPIYNGNVFGPDVRYGVKTHMPADAVWSGNARDDGSPA